MSVKAQPQLANSAAFEAEIDRLRALKVPGVSGRLREMFDFLAERGEHSDPATQDEIAFAVFGQEETDSDDATVRVYVHRLRKKLEDFYAGEAEKAGDGKHPPRLAIPAGIYVLRFEEPAGGAIDSAADRPIWRRFLPLIAALVIAAALALAFVAGRSASNDQGAPVNAIWQPFVDSERPLLIVLGDYYIYGEIDPIRPDEGRLIRDFRVDSASDLIRMQDLMPERFGNAEDVGLNYLPFSAAYGMQQIIPVMTGNGKQISVLAASELEPDMLNYFDVVYIGLFSGMNLLEELNFTGSTLDLGETYDELVDSKTGETHTSDEARSVASPAYYRDFGYISRFHSPSGALVAVLAGSRDTGVRAMAPLMTGALAPEGVADQAAGTGAFEALYQITGQQGADLAERLILSRERE